MMMNNKLTLVTNNPLLLNSEHPFAIIEEKTSTAVIAKCRDLIHQGAKLVTHPLAGSIKPWETPFRSVILDCNHTELDMGALEMIESAVQKYQHQLRGVTVPVLTEQSLNDYQVIDKELINSAIKSLY
ncbi:GrdX family protein [Aliivibrio kagoshimensis]|uniref:GrdX family protein n=1 Tax=Aliivibrio kagoshimensis TaxID=2910230 RepID=UPI003D118E44